jgi:hypothetical protein
MGILDWFKNRPGQFDPDRVSDELVRWAVDKAITLTNPRLKLLPNCQQRLTPAVETTIAFLRTQVQALPPVRPVSSALWSSDPALRAFFVAPSDIRMVLGRSDNLRTCSTSFRNSTRLAWFWAWRSTSSAFSGWRCTGTWCSAMWPRPASVSRTTKRAFAAATSRVLRRIVGVEVFEYLVGQALSEIGGSVSKGRSCRGIVSLMRARLRFFSNTDQAWGQCSAKLRRRKRAGQTGSGAAGKRAATGSDRGK